MLRPAGSASSAAMILRYLLRMRTTLTIDDRIAKALKALAHRSGKPVKRAVEETLRAGLAVGEAPVTPRPYRVKPVSLGGVVPGIDLPYRLRYRLAWNHGLSRAVLRVYTRVLLDVYARGVPGGRTGSVTVMQRAGGGLNANLHFHTLVLDGVFTEEPGTLVIMGPLHGLLLLVGLRRRRLVE